MKILLALTLLINLLACSGNKGEQLTPLTPPNGPYSKDIKSLIVENDSIERYLADGIILRQTTNNQDNLFKNFLVRSRRVLVLLLDDSSSISLINQLELLILEADDLSIAVQDMSYVEPYKNGLRKLVEDLYAQEQQEAQNYIANFLFDKDNDKKIIREKEEGAADFLPGSSDSGLPFISPKSHPDKTGATSVITPTFDIGPLNYAIQFEYLVRFYNGDARKERMIKFYVGKNKEDIKNIDWIDLKVDIAPDAPSWGSPPVLSKPMSIPMNNSEVRIKVEYRSDANRKFTQGFNLFRFEIKEAIE